MAAGWKRGRGRFGPTWCVCVCENRDSALYKCIYHWGDGRGMCRSVSAGSPLSFNLCFPVGTCVGEGTEGERVPLRALLGPAGVCWATAAAGMGSCRGRLDGHVSGGTPSSRDTRSSPLRRHPRLLPRCRRLSLVYGKFGRHPSVSLPHHPSLFLLRVSLSARRVTVCFSGSARPGRLLRLLMRRLTGSLARASVRKKERKKEIKQERGRKCPHGERLRSPCGHLHSLVFATFRCRSACLRNTCAVFARSADLSHVPSVSLRMVWLRNELPCWSEFNMDNGVVRCV